MKFTFSIIAILLCFGVNALAGEEACEKPRKVPAFCETGAQNRPSPDQLTLAMLSNCKDSAEQCLRKLIGEHGYLLGYAERVSLLLTLDEAKRWKSYGKKGKDINSSREIARAVAATALAEGARNLDENFFNVLLQAALSRGNPAVYSHLMSNLWRDIQWQLQACHDVSKTFANPFSSKWKRKQALLCALRLNFPDLGRYAILDGWPGCHCRGEDGKSGRMFRAGKKWVCVSGISPRAPIDERMPETMGRFVANMSEWAEEHGMELKGVGARGCGVTRFVKDEKLDRFDEVAVDAETSPDGKARVAFDLGFVSSHAESRACDLSWVSFLPKGCDSKGKCEPVRFSIDGSDGCFYASVLDKYHKAKGVPMVRQLGTREAHCGSVVFKSFPRGAADYRALSANLENSERPDSFTESEWQQLRLGVAVRNNLVDSGFAVIDPFADADHLDHYHLSLPYREKDWQIMSSEFAVDRVSLRSLIHFDAQVHFQEAIPIQRQQIQAREKVCTCLIKDEILEGENNGDILGCD